MIYFGCGNKMTIWYPIMRIIKIERSAYLKTWGKLSHHLALFSKACNYLILVIQICLENILIMLSTIVVLCNHKTQTGLNKIASKKSTRHLVEQLPIYRFHTGRTVPAKVNPLVWQTSWRHRGRLLTHARVTRSAGFVLVQCVVTHLTV